MSSEKSLKTVFGFLNRSRFYPSYLITLVADGDDVFGVFPSGDPVKLIEGPDGDPVTKEEVSLRESFIPYASNKISDDFGALTSFGVSADKIFIGTSQEIFDELSREIDFDQHTGEELEILLEAHRGAEKFLAEKAQSLKPGKLTP